jgi:hypothetical protein
MNQPLNFIFERSGQVAIPNDLHKPPPDSIKARRKGPTAPPGKNDWRKIIKWAIEQP